jgi:hypothetical protein
MTDYGIERDLGSSMAVPDVQRCYLCGSNQEMTVDHIPPENLFPPPKPTNLITVPCCANCNQSYSLDDEAFRLFASSVIQRSPAGAWIWRHKVVGSSFQRSPKLRGNVKKHMIKVPVVTATGTYELAGLSIPMDRANRYLIRITKGLLFKFYPKFDYSQSTFEVIQLELNQETIEVLKSLFYDERGDRVFSFWRALAHDYTFGMFAYSFYEGPPFAVSVDNRKS